MLVHWLIELIELIHFASPYMNEPSSPACGGTEEGTHPVVVCQLLDSGVKNRVLDGQGAPAPYRKNE